VSAVAEVVGLATLDDDDELLVTMLEVVDKAVLLL